MLLDKEANLNIKNNLENTPLNQIEKLEQEDKPKVNHATTYNLDKIDLKELGDFNLSNIVLHQIVNRLVENRNDITYVFNQIHKILKNELCRLTN